MKKSKNQNTITESMISKKKKELLQNPLQFEKPTAIALKRHHGTKKASTQNESVASLNSTKPPISKFGTGQLCNRIFCGGTTSKIRRMSRIIPEILSS